LRPGKASEKTPKGVIPPSLCEISQNASRKKTCTWLQNLYLRRKLIAPVLNKAPPWTVVASVKPP
jgi:hypothetical protein